VEEIVKGSYRLKRPLDLFILITAHIVMLPVFLPLWVGLPILILIFDGRPILNRQFRVGKDGKEFAAYKFRTMRIQKPGEEWLDATANDDTRVTRLGKVLRKTALDELPQVLNIAKGDISFVGPRPLISEQVQEYTLMEPRFPERHQGKPGLTGVSQVYLPRNMHPTERLNHDLSYFKNPNLWVDIKLIFLSGFFTLTGKWGAGRRTGESDRGE
jgi:lipopolysaccharide/colanic/teichoic acid biosynthesis glycosyltransferase